MARKLPHKGRPIQFKIRKHKKIYFRIFLKKTKEKAKLLRVLTQVNSMKCLKQVFKWASSLRLTIFWKWEWYMWAYTRKSLLNIVFTTSLKLGGNGAPEKQTKGTHIGAMNYNDQMKGTIWLKRKYNNKHYLAFGEIWIHHQVEIQSSPSDIQHILEPRPL